MDKIKEQQVEEIEREFKELFKGYPCTDNKVFEKIKQKAKEFQDNLGCDEIYEEYGFEFYCTGRSDFIKDNRLCQKCKKLWERLEKIK